MNCSTNTKHDFRAGRNELKAAARYYLQFQLVLTSESAAALCIAKNGSLKTAAAMAELWDKIVRAARRAHIENGGRVNARERAEHEREKRLLAKLTAGKPLTSAEVFKLMNHKLRPEQRFDTPAEAVRFAKRNFEHTKKRTKKGFEYTFSGSLYTLESLNMGQNRVKSESELYQTLIRCKYIVSQQVSGCNSV